MDLDLKIDRKADILGILKEADDAMGEIRLKANEDGDIRLSKKITMQMIRIELAMGYLEEGDEETEEDND